MLVQNFHSKFLSDLKNGVVCFIKKTVKNKVNNFEPVKQFSANFSFSTSLKIWGNRVKN